MYWLERSLGFSYVWDRSRYDIPSLSTFTVKIRHSDWYLWESDRTLHLDTDWVLNLLCSPHATSISEFRLEMETLAWRANELRPILDSLKSFLEPSLDDNIRWELIEPFEESSWSGPTNVGGEDREVHSQRDKLDYRVTTLKWKRRSLTTEKIEQRWREEGSLLKLLEGTTKKKSAESDEDSQANSSERDEDSEEDSDDQDDDDDDDDGDGDVGEDNTADEDSHEDHHETPREEPTADRHAETDDHRNDHPQSEQGKTHKAFSLRALLSCTHQRQ
jgi:hypothetical protein